MQVILDSSFAHPGLAPIWGGRKESSGTGLGLRLTIERFLKILVHISLRFRIQTNESFLH